MVSPVNKSPTSRGVRNPQGIQHGTRRKAKNSRIQEAPHCRRDTTFHNDIPAIGNNSPLGDGDACRGRHLGRVRLPRDQSIIGLNGFLVVFIRSFRLVLGLKLRHLRLLRTLRNRMRCSHSLTRRTKEHSDRHNKSHHRNTNPLQYPSHTHRDLSFEVIESRQDSKHPTPPFTTMYRLGKWHLPSYPSTQNPPIRQCAKCQHFSRSPMTVVFIPESPTNPPRGRDN